MIYLLTMSQKSASCTKKAWDNALLILMEASPNAFQRNKQPTPRRTAIPEPLLRGGYMQAMALQMLYHSLS